MAQFAGALLDAPGTLFEELARQTAWLLHDVASSLAKGDDNQFWEVWDRVAPHAFQSEDGTLAADPVTRSINIPAGLLTEAILDRLAARRPHSAAEIDDPIWQRLNMIADGTTREHTYARVLLASRLSWLHMLSADWVAQHLLKYFDWIHSTEAAAIWQGYLWQARVTPELWKAIKSNFLLALREKHKLGAFEESISTLFGYICIDHQDWFSGDEIQNALRLTDAKGREAVARVVFRRLQGAGDQSEDMWRTRIRPWLDLNWPKDVAMVHSESAFNLAMAAAHTGTAFESAVNLVAPFLAGSEDYSRVVDRLNETDYPEQSPSSVLRLLDVVDTNYMWPDRNLRALLTRLQVAQTALANDARFLYLDDYLRQHNL